MRRTSLALVAFALALPVAAAEAPLAVDHVFPIGRDFCFHRAYSATHLEDHPHQQVTAITVMGRNAHRTAARPGTSPDERTVSGFNVRASLRIRFRDGVTREWPGTCHDSDGEEGSVLCRFVPHRNVDSVDFALDIMRERTSVTALARGDVLAFRKAAEPPTEDAASDDRRFSLRAISPSECRYSRTYWEQSGATAQLDASLP